MPSKSLEKLPHDALIRRLRAAVRAVNLREAAESFLASLVSAPLRYRPSLGHLAFVANLPDHPFTPNRGAQSYMCAICGGSKVETIERDGTEKRLVKDGTTMADLEAALVDLEGFAKLPRVRPTADDLACFDAMLAVIDALPPEGRAADLVRKLRVPKSNIYGRASILETLGACGLFDAHDHVGHLTRWIGFWEYEEVPSTNGDMRPPEAWWRRAYGVSREALDVVFPFEGIDRERFPRGSTGPRPIDVRSVLVPRKGAQPEIELHPGDVVAFGRQKRWIAGVVLGAHEGPKRAQPVFEFYADSFTTVPDAIALVKAAPRLVGPYREAPHARREPISFEAVECGAMGIELERIGRLQPAIRSGAVLSPYRVVATRNLLYLMTTLAVPPPNLRA